MKKKIYIVGTIILLPVLIVAAFILIKEGKKLVVEAYVDSLPRATPVPSTDNPDLIRLTWSDDPRTTQAISWRMGPNASAGAVQVQTTGAESSDGTQIQAEKSVVEDPKIENDPVNLCFSAVITGLKPGTSYDYRVGNPETNNWSEWRSFKTAPEKEMSFSFFYLGDPQIGFAAWHELIAKAAEQFPSAAFTVIPGDLVNRGNDRDDWDDFLHAGEIVFSRIPLVPAIGNHERPKGSEPLLYLQLLTLPQNGAPTITPEKSYAFTYSNALFVILDSNEPPETQRDWLEQQLAQSEAVWKFVAFHHPVYSSKPNRDNPELRASWSGLFDKYHVDMVLQGHDHAYMRTHPLRDGKVAPSFSEGTVYVISVSGSKYYDFETRDVAAVTFGKTSTFQVIDIDVTQPDKHTLSYRAFDDQGTLRDEFIVEKPKQKQ
ncbi:MAG TPA: metallophosphoesterase family protein [Candidatus Hydrogenedentes bacterium]|nr:metallophosphoesterase family protein [Candidatus Hydrogenedentota bacterium]HOL76149.1 metallophosphoesterase family protein [Candidatus Hydrogenedentota bacterium]HPO84764.1 metallophosphoesterase family protein [Candidatus Hydrogenedentota bacterium]